MYEALTIGTLLYGLLRQDNAPYVTGLYRELLQGARSGGLGPLFICAGFRSFTGLLCLPIRRFRGVRAASIAAEFSPPRA